MGITDLIAGMRHRAILTKEFSDEDAAQTKVQEKKLSANERLLNSMLKKEREEAIKKEIEKRTKAEADKYWHHDIIHQENLFNKPNGNNLLKQPSLFGVGR